MTRLAAAPRMRALLIALSADIISTPIFERKKRETQALLREIEGKEPT